MPSKVPKNSKLSCMHAKALLEKPKLHLCHSPVRSFFSQYTNIVKQALQSFSSLNQLFPKTESLI